LLALAVGWGHGSQRVQNAREAIGEGQCESHRFLCE
jgi:hypothetical protein